jgi:hypothetical protein
MKAYTIAGVELPEYWDVLREAWEGRALGLRFGIQLREYPYGLDCWEDDEEDDDAVAVA